VRKILRMALPGGGETAPEAAAERQRPALHLVA